MTPHPDEPGTPSDRSAPLDGVLVADFSRVLAGPLASMFLADLGATVIKVERTGSGDDTRRWGPPYAGSTSTYFASVNRNKRSLELDLADPPDAELARELARRADVVLENFRVGALARFGLDADSVRAANPGAIYCSISGFGSGAGAELPGYDFVVQALGGLMSITGKPGGEPMKAGVALVDVLTGLHATIAIQAALLERARSGRGQHVEVNLLSSLLSSLVNQGSGYLNGGGVPSRMGNRHPSIAPYETLATRDGSLAVAIGNDRQFAAMADVLGGPALAEDPAFATNHARVLHRNELVAALEEPLRARTTDEWTVEFRARGLPCGRVNDIAQAIGLATELGLDPVVTLPSAEDDASGIATLANPLRLHDTPVRYHRAPPALGADSAALRGWLSDSEAARLPE